MKASFAHRPFPSDVLIPAQRDTTATGFEALFLAAVFGLPNYFCVLPAACSVMKNIKKINKILRVLQLVAAAFLTFMMVRAMRTLYMLMKGEGHF